jgi:hypothetical protein
MTAKQLLEFAAQHITNTDLFSLLGSLQQEQLEIARQLETDPKNKNLVKQYADICEKMQMIQLMQSQRLELFYQSGL